jgi:hypothetical protein
MTTLLQRPTAKMTNNWLEIDREGLAKLHEGRPKSFVLNELISNAWDEASREVKVTIAPSMTRGYINIYVEDDNPEGFKNLSHAYTLFAESHKKGDAEQRGRFNLGEKLVLALAHTAMIETTTGAIEFKGNQRRHLHTTRNRGSLVMVEIKATKAEMEEIIASAGRLIPPHGIKTTVNGVVLHRRPPLAWFEVTLPTVIADEEGVLRRTERKTRVRVHEPRNGQPGTIYEMGIPVVESGDRFDVDVQQKVPLNSERDNVTPGFLRDLRVAVLNNTFGVLSKEDVTQGWVRDACGDEKVAPDALRTVIDTRFGQNAVAYDPSDREANKISASEDRQIVHGGHLSAGEWANVRLHGLLPAAGKVTPSPKPYDPDGDALTLIPVDDWSVGMLLVADFAQEAAQELLDQKIKVRIANEPDWPVAATFGRSGSLVFNVAKLSPDFFELGITEDVIDLLIHEFGHHWTTDHLSRDYYDALTKLGAKMTFLAIRRPELFK